ncbi:hypothetical protein LWI28_024574 [Acer negundo]|uniref:Protein FAR1-RELATED SEQUENCE n=1 Tax=Acer negundo TaxID=4023 RepID=A0AAD5JAR9_ACENE|nr:hypothetical protein LWI28_024574 [Acer negundo]
MLEQHGLEENDWMSRMYEKKHRWAEAYFEAIFLQACAQLKNARGPYAVKKQFLCDEYVSKCKSSVILSHLKPLEEHASSVYTYQIYLDVAKQIMHESKYTHIAPEEEDNCRVYHLSRYQFPNKKKKVVYHLDRADVQEFDEDGVRDSEKHNQPLISYDCNLFEGKGIHCHHMFYIMKVEHLKKIPESMIFKRGTKSATRDVFIKLQPDDEFSKGIDISQFSSLSAECNYLYHNGSQTEEGFNLVKMELIVLQNTLQELNDEIRNKAKKNKTDSGPQSHIIKDPNVFKTKARPSGSIAPSTPAGKPQKRRRPNQCWICHTTGHDSRNYKLMDSDK